MESRREQRLYCIFAGLFSGNQWRLPAFFEVGGKRYHHIIDPATQMPANYVNSVSVRCKDSGVADGLSTALFNMPVEEGMALIESLPDTEAIWMLPDHTVKMSSGFDQWCKKP